MKIYIEDQIHNDTQIIRHILSPWTPIFTHSDSADVSIVYGGIPQRDDPTIIIPSNSKNFSNLLKHRNIGIIKKPQKENLVNISQQTTLSIISEIQYDYNGAIDSTPSTIHQPSVRVNDTTLLLRMNILDEYKWRISKILNPKPSNLYNLLTGFPIPYNLAPKRIRNVLMKLNVEKKDLTLLDKLPLDTLRFILVKAIEEITNKKMEKKEWNGKRFPITMTHDIESRDGFKKAKILKRLEKRYDIPSAWYIPAKHCAFDPTTIDELANHGEIGVHGIEHDGKLAGISKSQLLQRLSEAKQIFEKLSDYQQHQTLGFRAPLLQHNITILNALEETGYNYDASVPTWEPKHPYVMKPYGIGTVYPIKLGKITEIPLTLPQDHQMLHILGLTPTQTVTTWIKLKETIRDIGGICSILVHPDYEFSDSKNLDVYEELLNDIASDNNAWVTIPAEIEACF